MSSLARATIAPQPGPQTDFLRTPADICVYGGAAGGGKTVGLILEPLRYVSRVPGFTAVFFRRTTPQVTNPGGLWDESLNFYPQFGGTPRLRAHEWRWPRAGKIKFSHLQFDTTVYDWQGAQITLICFDELTHFTARQFFYMVSRNRSTCGVRPYIRATCNPDADSWVAEFLAWWIDQETGLPIPERAGVLRHFIRVSEKVVWADRPEELMQQMKLPQDLPPGADPPRPISAQHRHPGRQAGRDWVRSGSRAGRQKPGAASGAGAERLHGALGGGEWRQADAVRAVQLAVPRRQCKNPARPLERGPVPCPRR